MNIHGNKASYYQKATNFLLFFKVQILQYDRQHTTLILQSHHTDSIAFQDLGNPCVAYSHVTFLLLFFSPVADWEFSHGGGPQTRIIEMLRPKREQAPWAPSTWWSAYRCPPWHCCTFRRQFRSTSTFEKHQFSSIPWLVNWIYICQ